MGRRLPAPGTRLATADAGQQREPGRSSRSAAPGWRWGGGTGVPRCTPTRCRGRRPDRGRFPRPWGVGHAGRQRRTSSTAPGGGRPAPGPRRGGAPHPRLLGGGQQRGRARGDAPPCRLAVGLAAPRWGAGRRRPGARTGPAWSALARTAWNRPWIRGPWGPAGSSATGPSDPADAACPRPSTSAFPGPSTATALLMQLDLAGVAASLGSACARRGRTEPSPTLGRECASPTTRLRSSVRFSPRRRRPTAAEVRGRDLTGSSPSSAASTGPTRASEVARSGSGSPRRGPRARKRDQRSRPPVPWPP